MSLLPMLWKFTLIVDGQFVIYRENDAKRYDFEAKNSEEAADIVTTVKKGIPPNQ